MRVICTISIVNMVKCYQKYRKVSLPFVIVLAVGSLWLATELVEVAEVCTAANINCQNVCIDGEHGDDGSMLAGINIDTIDNSSKISQAGMDMQMDTEIGMHGNTHGNAHGNTQDNTQDNNDTLIEPMMDMSSHTTCMTDCFDSIGICQQRLQKKADFVQVFVACLTVFFLILTSIEAFIIFAYAKFKKKRAIGKRNVLSIKKPTGIRSPLKNKSTKQACDPNKTDSRFKLENSAMSVDKKQIASLENVNRSLHSINKNKVNRLGTVDNWVRSS
jgi:hypothetical protein